MKSRNLVATNGHLLTMVASNGFLNNGFAFVTEVGHPEDEVASSGSLILQWETKRIPVTDYNPLVRKSRVTAIVIQYSRNMDFRAQIFPSYLSW
jgi:hypothetical protein